MTAVEEPMAVAERTPYRLTADKFERMGEVGILDEDDRVELIDGEIVAMAAVNVKHANCVGRLTMLLARAVPGGTAVRVQDPVRLNEIRQPQPDLLVIHDRKYDAIPAPADVLLLIEVSESTLVYDRARKMLIYAAANIAEYWVADVNGRTVERFAEPGNGMYRRHDTARIGDTPTSLTVPQIAGPIADIWE